jgi:hypothetical protein
MGTIGPMGHTGPQGNPGLQGPQGPHGGPTGPTGIAGIPGQTGPTGSRGPVGNMGPAGNNGKDGSTGSTGSTGPQGNSITGPTGNTGAQGQPGPISNNFTEYILKIGSGSITSIPKALDTTYRSSSGSVGAYTIKYATDDNYTVNSITIANNRDLNPNIITFTLTTSGTISKAFLATSAFGHNFNPLTIVSNTPILTQSFADTSEYSEYITHGAVFFLTVKWIA